MPLSDHEQKLLDQIEQALYRDDPKFAASVRSARRRTRTRRAAVLCVLGALAGLGLVLVGLVINIIALSVVGFVLLVASCGYGAQLIRNRHNRVESSPSAPDPDPTNIRSARSSNNLRSRMEERLRRRFDENQ